MSHKYLYLDIDGVLNSVLSESDELSDASLDILHEVQHKYNCTIVISSTWRLHNNSRLLMEQLLVKHNIVQSSGQLLYTPDLLGMGTRADEIIESLKSIISVESNVIQYVIVDDMDILCSESIQIQRLLAPHTVQIDGDIGLCKDDITRIDSALIHVIEPYQQFKQVILSHDHMQTKHTGIDRNAITK